MKSLFPELSPGDTQATSALRQELIEFWNGLRTCGDPGATTWEVLESLERQVTECLNHDPPDIQGAQSATALAGLLMLGNSDL